MVKPALTVAVRTVSVLWWPAWSGRTLSFSRQIFLIREKSRSRECFYFHVLLLVFLHAILICCRDACAWDQHSYKLSVLQACHHCLRHNSEFEMAFLLPPKLSGALCCLPSPDCSLHLQQAGLFCLQQPHSLGKDTKITLKIWVRSLLMSGELYQQTLSDDFISRPVSQPRCQSSPPPYGGCKGYSKEGSSPTSCFC